MDLERYQYLQGTGKIEEIANFNDFIEFLKTTKLNSETIDKDNIYKELGFDLQDTLAEIFKIVSEEFQTTKHTFEVLSHAYTVSDSNHQFFWDANEEQVVYCRPKAIYELLINSGIAFIQDELIDDEEFLLDKEYSNEEYENLIQIMINVLSKVYDSSLLSITHISSKEFNQKVIHFIQSDKKIYNELEKIKVSFSLSLK